MRTLRLAFAMWAVALAALAPSAAAVDAQSRDKPATVTFTVEGMT